MGGWFREVLEPGRDRRAARPPWLPALGHDRDGREKTIGKGDETSARNVRGGKKNRRAIWSIQMLNTWRNNKKERKYT